MELSQPAERLAAPLSMPLLPGGPLAAPPTPQPAFGVPTPHGDASAPPSPPSAVRRLTLPDIAVERPVPALRLAEWTSVVAALPGTEPAIAPPPSTSAAELTPPAAPSSPAEPAVAIPALADTALADTALTDTAVANEAVADEAVADTIEPAVAQPPRRGPKPVVVAVLVVTVLAIVALAVRSSRTEFVRGDAGTSPLTPTPAAVGAEGVAAVPSPSAAPPQASAPVASGATIESFLVASDSWLAWVASAPAATNPLVDTTGEHCGRNQNVSGVFFLAGSFGEKIDRVCQVPANRLLVVPAINSWCDPVEATCGDSIRTATTSITVDGVEQPTFFRDAQALDIDAAEGNPIVATVGPTQLTMSGEWAKIGPLAPGSHTVRIQASTEQFALDVRYLLIVE